MAEIIASTGDSLPAVVLLARMMTVAHDSMLEVLSRCIVLSSQPTGLQLHLDFWRVRKCVGVLSGI